MCKVMSSGVLPKYLENPAASIRNWNRVLRDPNYDPAQSGGRPAAGKTEFADSLDFKCRQLEAAKLCARELEAARPLVGALPHFKRCYFVSLAEAAPGWVEQARELVARAEIDATLEEGNAATTREMARTAAGELQKGKVRSRLEHIAEILVARSDDAAQRARHLSARVC